MGRIFLKEAFELQDASRIYQKLVHLAKNTAQALVENLDDSFGELRDRFSTGYRYPSMDHRSEFKTFEKNFKAIMKPFVHQ
ncbi:hypothetical protein RCO48_01075 [Peribacillus frigoritolerans]|nr:hypothetical protein [Peribacillus frigoritolerans]